jgi:hypothetical protein
VSEIVPDHIHAGTFVVRQGVTEQSWVDLDDPLRVEFEYVRRIVEALEATLLARRPGTIQVVLEPDADLVEQVRARLPLAREATVRIRIVDGRAGLGGFRPASVDGVVLDAFVGAQVPGELATRECFEAVGAILADTGLLAMNLGDRAPFDWGRRCLAGLAGQFPHLALSAEIAVWKGRRYGNLVALASRRPLPLDALERDLTRTAFGYRLLSGGPLRSWIGGAEPFTDGDTRDSIDPVAHGWLR